MAEIISLPGIYSLERKDIRSLNIQQKGIYSLNIQENGVEWSKDKTQAAESIKWRPQQAYGSNQFYLFSRRQFSAQAQNHYLLTYFFILNVLGCQMTY